MPVVAKFMTQIRDLGGFASGPRNSVAENTAGECPSQAVRPYQEAHSISDLTSTEKAEFADLLEAEIARF